MSKQYEPEIGQAVFGAPWREFECPDFVRSGLEYLDNEIRRVEGNNGREYSSPLANSGASFQTPIFEMRAYYWGDEEEESCKPNFECGDFEISWYKYFGRGTTMNQDVDANGFAKILDRCLKSMRERDVEM